MSPAPMARARPSPICARSWKPLGCAFTSTPRPIWSASTSVFGSAASAAVFWSATTELLRALEHCERVNAGAPITFFESQDRGGVLAVRPACGRRAAPGSRPRRPARCHQRGRCAAGGRHHAGRIDHPEFLGDTLAEIAAEKAGILKRDVPGDLSRAGAGGAGRDRAAGGAPARAASCRRRGLACQRRSAAGWSIRTIAACSICRRRSCTAGISSRMPARRSRRCARPRLQDRPPPRSRAGMTRVEWPARMQRLAHGALPALAPAGQRDLARRRP